MSRRAAWAPREDSELRRNWAAEIPAENIARMLGRSTFAVYSRAKLLGLPRKTGAARDANRQAKLIEIEAERIKAIRTDDEAYTAACNVAGGFAPFTEQFTQRIEAARRRAA